METQHEVLPWQLVVSGSHQGATGGAVVTVVMETAEGAGFIGRGEPGLLITSSLGK